MFSNIPRHELAIVVRLFVFCLFAGSSYTLAKTAADSLFLSRIGSESLPLEFLAAGVATTAFAMLWVRAAKRISIGRMLRITSAVLAVFYIAAWWTLPLLHHSFALLSVVYVLAEIKGCLYAIVAISAMNETLGRNSSRQSWTTILLGFPLAAIIVGTAVGFESTVWDADNWLLVAGLLDLCAIATGVRLKPGRNNRSTEKMHLTDSDDRERQLPVAGEPKPIKKYAGAEAFARWFSVLFGAKVLVLTLVAFNWKVSVNNFFDSNEQLLASYFGSFYAMAGMGTLLLQLFITGKLLARKSVALPILLLPVLLLVLNVMFITGGGIGLSVAFLFYVATFAKATDTWRRSTHDTAIHLLYTSVEIRKRRGLIGHNHGLVKPGAEIAAGVILVSSTVWIQHAVLVTASIIWLIATFALVGIMKSRRA